jgi:hypothetical protein
MDKNFRTWENLFEDHNTDWETFDHTYQYLALECRISGYREFSPIVRADRDLTIFIIEMKIAIVLGSVQIT